MNIRVLGIMGSVSLSLAIMGVLTGCNEIEEEATGAIHGTVNQYEITQESMDTQEEYAVEMLEETTVNVEHENSVIIEIIENPEESVEVVEYAEKAVEDAYAELNGTVHITKNSDGTYSFSEEFIGAITSYSFFDGATEAEVNEWLQSQGYLFSIIDGQSVDDIMTSTFSKGKLHKEPVQQVVEQSKPSSGTDKQPASTGNTGNSGNGSNSGNSGTSGNGNNAPVENTPPVENVEDDGFDNLIENPDGTLTTPDGTFTFDDPSTFGQGGEFIDPGDAWNIH